MIAATTRRPLTERIAAAPISWGVCEVPGWGWQHQPPTVLTQMRDLGIAATEFGPDGFLPDDPQGKADLVSRLLEGKASAETVRLARQSVLAPRGRRFDRTLEEYLDIAAERRQQLTAVVTTAVDLTQEQHARLAGALQQIYSKPVQLQIVHDEDVIGGIRVQIGDEVVDGTVLRRLDEAKRHLAG